MSISLLAGFSAYHGIRYVFFPPKRNVVIKMEPVWYGELEKFKNNFSSMEVEGLDKKLEDYAYSFSGFYHMNYLPGKNSLKVKTGFSSRRLKGICVGKVILPDNLGKLEELLANNEVLVNLNFFAGSSISFENASGKLKLEKDTLRKIHFIKDKKD